MFKALFAALCITICCIGNDYPATAHHGQHSDHQQPQSQLK